MLPDMTRLTCGSSVGSLTLVVAVVERPVTAERSLAQMVVERPVTTERS